jgi:hypothetical protein
MASRLKGSPELKARLKAVRQSFKPIGAKWADKTASIYPGMAPTRPATMRAGDGHAPGRLRGSFVVKKRTAYKAVVGGHYSAYFVNKGVKAHSMQKRAAGQDRTVFAKKHPGYTARPFLKRGAWQSLDRFPMSDTLIGEWNKAG